MIRGIFLTAAMGIVISVSPFSFASASGIQGRNAATVGLIEKGSVFCTGKDGKVMITAKTQASGKMREVGFREMSVQYSDDCEIWYNEILLGNTKSEDSSRCVIDNKSVDVSGGHYYRVVCEHYAIGEMPITGNECMQTAENESSPVWVDEANSINNNSNTVTNITSASTTTTVTTTTASATTAKRTDAQNKNGSTSLTSKTVIATATTLPKAESPSTGDNFPTGAAAIAALAATAAVLRRKDNE